MIQSHYYGVMGSWYTAARKDISPLTVADLKKYRFLSLSARANRSQMWGYYVDTFKGVCLVYSTKKAFKNYEDILYLNEQDRENICKILENPDEKERELIAKYNLLLKSDDWIKEDEVRIIINVNQKFIEFDNNELIGIILGHNIDKKYKNDIITAARNNNIELYKTYLDNLKLKVDILPHNFNVEEVTGMGQNYEEALAEWINKDYNKGKYSLGIDGQMLDTL